VLVLDADGAVRAHIGGRDGRSNRLDRATEIRRQPGSVFKLFVYAEAFRQGASPEDMIEDAPIVIDGWAPRNIDGRFYGPVTLEEAFARSLNTVAVRLAQQTSIPAIIRLAQRLGIESELRAVPSLALGTSEVSLLELARAFLPFVSGGMAPGERFIERVQDGAGRILAVSQPAKVQVLDARTVAAMQRLLRAAVTRGTGQRADIPGRRIFGKTGTSQDGRDGWFLGSDGRYIVAVWVGRDDYRPVRGLTGGNTPAQIARAIFEALPATVAHPAGGSAAGSARPRDPLETLLDWVEQVFSR
jgi:penicillin-binding protein 1A